MTLKVNENGIDRNMTETEEAAYLALSAQIQAQAKAQADETKIKAEKKASALAKLGLSADEAAALFE